MLREGFILGGRGDRGSISSEEIELRQCPLVHIAHVEAGKCRVSIAAEGDGLMSELKNNTSLTQCENEAYKFVDEMVKRPDGLVNGIVPYWYGWALRKAFEAGFNYCKENFIKEKMPNG